MLQELLNDIAGASLNTKLFMGASITVLSLAIYFILKKSPGIIVALGLIGVLHVIFGVLLAGFVRYSLLVHTIVYFIPSLLGGLVASLVLVKAEPKGSRTFQVNYQSNKGVVSLDLWRGGAIFGASGYGKTKSVFLPIIEHCAIRNLSAIIYDYANSSRKPPNHLEF